MSDLENSLRSIEKVQIVGGAVGPESALIEWDNELAVQWGCNLYYRSAPFEDYGWDAWFELHVPDWQDGNHPHHFFDLHQADCPVYMTEERKDLCPHSEAYPLKAVDALAGGCAWHASTHDYQIGLAILTGVPEIELIGIPAGENTGEPRAARACMEFWLGIAIGRGVRVTAYQSCLFKGIGYYYTSAPYGYEFQQRYHGGLIVP